MFQHPRTCFVLALLFLAPKLAVAAEMTEEHAKALNTAQENIQNSKFADAVKPLEELADEYPDMADIPRLLAHCHFGLGDFEKARAYALEALGQGRLTTDILTRLVQIDRKRNDELALVNSVRLLTIIHAENADWRLLYAQLLSENQSFEESAAVYRELLEKEPQRKSLHIGLAGALLKQGELRSAATELETAYHLGDTNPHLPRTLAGIWVRLGNEREALSWTERALSLDPEQADKVRLQRAQLLYQLKRYDEAQHHATSLMESEDVDIARDALLLAGQIHKVQDQTDQAVAFWQRAVDLGADSPELLSLLAGHYYNAGDMAAAIKPLTMLVKNEDGSDEQHLRFLILAMVQEGQHSEARPYLRRYIELNGLGQESKKLVRYWSQTQAG